MIGKKKLKSYPLNVNTFANNHFADKHKAKDLFYEYIESLGLLEQVGEINGKIQVHYTYYSEKNGLFDEANIGGGLDKFLADALVNIKLIPDDNYNFVKHYTFEYAGTKKHVWNNPRLKGLAVVTIYRVS